MAPATGLLGRLTLGLASAVGLYAVALGVLLTPPAQRFALYAHKFSTLFLDDLNNPESFGFARNQVTPFNIRTTDGETLYAWHVLPLNVYAEHERDLRDQERPHAPVKDFTKTPAFQLLTSKSSPPPRVIISFHGNAGHIAQNFRPDTYRHLTTRPNTHVFAIDYRGFGLSTGSPTEAGLIDDATALIDFVLNVAQIPPERIVIIGQSLGTAVSSAVALRFADPGNKLISYSLDKDPQLRKAQPTEPTTFAGIVLAAPFSSIPSLLLTYRIGGLLPILLPLRPFPSFAGLLTSQMVDKWLSAERIHEYYNVLQDSPKLYSGDRRMGTLQILHATNDADIPYHQTEMICRRMLDLRDAKSEVNSTEIDAVQCIDGSKGAAVLDVNREGFPRVRFEIVEYGGHNRIITYSPVGAALNRAIDDLFD